MKRSETITELAKALSKAQHEMGPAKIDMKNSFLKYKYPSLSSVINACEPILKNGISIIQTPTDDGKYMETTFLHTSGEWISGLWPILCPKYESQIYGSATTYAKRYGLSAMANISAEEDDDAELTKPTEIKKPMPVNNQKTVAGNFKPKEVPKQIPNTSASKKEYTPARHFE